MNGASDETLPPGWLSAEIGHVGTLFCGQSPPSSSVNTDRKGFPYVSGPEHWDGSVVRLNKWTTAPSQIVPAGTVFVTVKGAGVGTVFPGVHAAIGRDIYAFMPEPGVSPGFITHALRFTTSEIVRQAQGDIPGLSKEHILRHDIPLPPADEQQRIASSVDELFSDLDAGMAALGRVREKLKLYRASVLKSAVEGALTAEWRAEHPHAEPASELLERILAERRRRWEEDQLAKFKARGQEPPKNWKGKYKEPAAPDSTNLPPLPEGWCWIALDQHSTLVTSGSRGWMEYYSDDGALFIRSQDIRTDRLELGETAHVSVPEASEGTRTKVSRGDILITITGANVAKAATVDVELTRAYVSQHVALVRLVSPELGRFVHMYAVTPSGGRMRLLKAAYGAGKPGLNLDNLRELPVPVPPLAEQQAIVEAVEDQLSVIDHLEADLDAKLKGAQGLRQAILRHAFTGRLVPQDPNDEPASELLKRIAAERERRGAGVKRRRSAVS